MVFLTSIGIRAKALTWGILADWSVTQVTEYVISTNGDLGDLPAYQSSVYSCADMLISWDDLPMAFERS